MAGAVYDAEALSPIVGATARLGQSGPHGITDAGGSFLLDSLTPGTHVLTVQHPAYGSVTREFSLEAGQRANLTIYMEELPTEQPRPDRSSGREILRADIEAAALQGLNLLDLLLREMPSIRVRDGGVVGGGTCIEYRGGAGSACRQLGLVIDGVRSQNPSFMFETIPLADIDRVLLLAPAEAGTRYGGVGGWGILVVETRRGRQAARAPGPERLISGFDWSEEPMPYPWTRVIVSTAVANGIGLAVSYKANSCLRMSRKVRYVAIRSECDAWGTVGSVLLMTALPSLGASLAARWAGSTERSRGRLGPSAIIGTALTIGGYVALMYGDAEDNPAGSVAGIALLTVGTPLFLTLADRLLRVLR